MVRAYLVAQQHRVILPQGKGIVKLIASVIAGHGSCAGAISHSRRGDCLGGSVPPCE